MSMRIEPADLVAMLGDGDELAIVDVREELLFSQAHLLHARSAPLSRLELRIAALVPRFATRIVICDGGDGLADRAVQVLSSLGYTTLFILDGGTAAWQAAGLLLFSGVNVPSKAFGEFVEDDNHTPSVSAAELHGLLESQADVVVLDSRPFDEYARGSIPTAINVPGAELVLRARDMVPSPATTVVVNCAGRTRSIIGAQSLIDAGLPNKVIALRNGTMGWQLAGFASDNGANRRAAPPSAAALAWAKGAADHISRRFGVTHVDMETVRRWSAERDKRTLYLFDVRDPAEYDAGHVPGARSTPGGQLVQATDQYIGTLNARVVLIDDLDVRAVMTASWLLRMGLKDVFVLAASGAETGHEPDPVPIDSAVRGAAIDAEALSVLLEQGGATVLDLSPSREFRRRHIPGAWFAIRSRLARALPRVPLRKTLVLTSEDGKLAALALKEAMALVDVPVRWLEGGNAAWKASGRPFATGDDMMADEPVDIWLKPYERPVGTTAAMSEYLAWEIDLLERVREDGTCRFVPAAQSSGRSRR